MITRAVKVQLVAFLVITCLGISYVSASYIGLTDSLFHRQYTVRLDLAQTGGLFQDAEVTYRGVTVGKVGSLALTPTGVRAKLLLDRKTPVPSDATAVIAERSAVGEQYVELEPNRRGGPYLHDGSVIPRSRTELPITATQLLLHLDKLLNSVNKQDLSTVITELNAAFANTGPALQALLDNGDQLLTDASANLGPTTRLIEDGRVVLDTQLASADSIRSFATHLRSLTQQLDRSDPDLRRLLDNGAASAPEVTDLLHRLDPSLGLLLGNLVTVGGLSSVRLPGIRQILVEYPDVVAGTMTVVADGTSHVGLVVDSTPPPCTNGYESTQKRYPQATSDDKANDRAQCRESATSTTDVRGTQHAPGPTGRAPTDPGPSGSGPDSSEPTGRYRYNPATGQVNGPDGGPMQLGSTGGQQRVYGNDSWKMLLLNPLSR
ncbi:MAG: MCE family protein [Streptosporangiales bacterium]|nr:MCE family protein [Streptosporangiales bacterium]MBO0891916.1 MCE family protein [Acidothermales bacterium]